MAKVSLRNSLRAFLLLFRKPNIVTINVQSLRPSELLKGRCALVTGGTSGIGYAIALAFLKAGACVIITGRSQERVNKAMCMLQEHWGGAYIWFRVR